MALLYWRGRPVTPRRVLGYVGRRLARGSTAVRRRFHRDHQSRGEIERLRRIATALAALQADMADLSHSLKSLEATHQSGASQKGKQPPPLHRRSGPR